MSSTSIQTTTGTRIRCQSRKSRNIAPPVLAHGAGQRSKGDRRGVGRHSSFGMPPVEPIGRAVSAAACAQSGGKVVAVTVPGGEGTLHQGGHPLVISLKHYGEGLLATLALGLELLHHGGAAQEAADNAGQD